MTCGPAYYVNSPFDVDVEVAFAAKLLSRLDSSLVSLNKAIFVEELKVPVPNTKVIPLVRGNGSGFSLPQST
jgi:hypothetical protein